MTQARVSGRRRARQNDEPGARLEEHAGPQPLDRAIRDVALSDLRFDPDNPRLPQTIDRNSDVAVLEWMLEDATLLELMRSIGAQGYFPGEPILVTSQAPGEPGGPPYLVVEGNRRFAAALLLGEPERAPTRRSSVRQAAQEAAYHPRALPALVFGARDDVLDYLGFRHVTGIKPWDPLAKARYVNQLLERASTGEAIPDLREIARKIGSRADYVEKLLSGLWVYGRTVDSGFFGLRGVTEETIDFSVLTTALSYAAIRDWLRLADTPSARTVEDGNLKDLIDWLFRELPSGKTVVGESRNLRTVAEIVEYPKAVDALRKGEPLQSAAQLTGEPVKVFRESLRGARDGMERARDQVHRVELPTDQDLGILGEISTITRDLTAVVRSRIEDSDASP